MPKKQQDSSFCPPRIVRVPKNWDSVAALFRRGTRKPLSVKTKKSQDKRKHLEPFFSAITDYVNDHTRLQAMVEALDKAATYTNAMLRSRTVMGRVKQADGTLSARRGYKVEMRIILKGGNLLRLYQLLYQHVMPWYMFKAFEKNYMDYFKKGDLDVEYLLMNQADPKDVVYLDDDDPEAQETLQVVSYVTLLVYRNLLFQNEMPYQNLVFCGESASAPATQHTMDGLLATLRKEQSNLLDTPEEKRYKDAKLVGVVMGNVLYGLNRETLRQGLARSVKTGQFNDNEKRLSVDLQKHVDAFRVDLFTELDEKDESMRYFYPLSRAPGSNLFITIHRQLRFIEEAPSGGELVKNFMLGRLMLNTVLVFRNDQGILPVRMRGEIIDFATSYSNDVKLKLTKGFIALKSMGFKYIDIFDANYLLQDLYSMLFKEVAYPWADKKYKKRLVRLLFFQWLMLADGVNPITSLLSKLHLKKAITKVNYKRHAFVKATKLMLRSDAVKEPEFVAFLKVINEFRAHLVTMLTTHRKRKDQPLKHDDIVEALKMRGSNPGLNV